MSFRGRGRGRFGGGGFARQEPFVLFPDIELPDPKDVGEERALLQVQIKLSNGWKKSAYYLEEKISQKNQSIDVERFSDREKPKPTFERQSLDQFLQLRPENFPKELIKGLKRGRPNRKKVQWNLDSGMDKLDLFEKLEQKYEGQEEKDEKEKKEDEDEEDEEEDQVEEDYTDDDYNQNEDFDDDEDDFNMDDDNYDEGVY